MRNDERYSAISILNHWVTALLVVAMLALGWAAAAAPSEVVEEYILGVHISLGFFAFLFVAWRIAFRLYEGFPDNIGPTVAERWAAYIAHRAILALLAIQVVTGPMYLFTENECMDVFGWFSVCVPLEGLSVIHGAMEWLHVYIGVYILPAILVLHLVGAGRHYAVRGRQETPSDL